jgi:hypothetical protein
MDVMSLPPGSRWELLDMVYAYRQKMFDVRSTTVDENKGHAGKMQL